MLYLIGETKDELGGSHYAFVNNLDGGDGNDIMVVDDAGDVANGGAGTDTVQITAAITYTVASDVETISNTSGSSGSVITLNALANTYGGNANGETVNAGDGADIVYGRAGDDALSGEGGNDRIFGDAGGDQLSGGDGNDLLYAGADSDTASGGAGNDTLYGEGGNDILTGGTGLDILNGGLGADTFVFSTGDTGATTATADRIQGFSSAQGDVIDLQFADVSSFIGAAAFSNTAGELRSELIGGNTYVQGDVDGDGVADFMIRIDGNVMLSSNDFLFVVNG